MQMVLWQLETAEKGWGGESGWVQGGSGCSGTTGQRERALS